MIMVNGGIEIMFPKREDRISAVTVTCTQHGYGSYTFDVDLHRRLHGAMICGACGVRYKLDPIFKECPACGYVEREWVSVPAGEIEIDRPIDNTLMSYLIDIDKVRGGVR